ncbi:acyl-CoA desaturase [Patescibacteria group bacterium]|nr:acyl-CoA desaturase [Patescibacteria group bacterium]
MAIWALMYWFRDGISWHSFVHGYSRKVWFWFFGIYMLRSIGVSLGYHRLFTHRSFKCHFFTQEVIHFFGAMAAQGHWYDWRRNHKQHHWDTEGPWDPHTPTKYKGIKGLLWAHMGWLFFEVKEPPNAEVIFALGRENTTMANWRWDKTVYFLGMLSGFVLPFIFAGFPGLLLAGFGGVVVSLEFTWAINSWDHFRLVFHKKGVHGRTVKEQSKNSPLIAIPNFSGEPWHENHHRMASVAFLGWRWWQIDMPKWVLIGGENFGIFWDINRPPV